MDRRKRSQDHRRSPSDEQVSLARSNSTTKDLHSNAFPGNSAQVQAAAWRIDEYPAHFPHKIATHLEGDGGIKSASALSSL